MNKVIHAIMVGLVSFTAASMADSAPNGHYRWTDDKGIVQYSDRPPEGVEAEFIKSNSSRSDTSSKAKSANAKSEADAEGQTAKGPQELEILPEKDPELCKQAQANMKALEAARIRITDPDGSKRFLTEEEKEFQRDNARKFISIHC